MRYGELRGRVLQANLELVRQGLVLYTWGNVSEIDRQEGCVAIKPSGVEYESLTAEKIVIVDLAGKRIDGELNPSSDLDTHLALYRAFAGIGGVAHTHSLWATTWAQAGRGIPCYGTTQADYCRGEIPVTRTLTAREIAGRYEAETGNVIAERFAGLDAGEYHGVLVHSHGPFSWGKDGAEAVCHAKVIEYVAQMALGVQVLSPEVVMQPELIDKHFLRKHGPNAYYGQK